MRILIVEVAYTGVFNVVDYSAVSFPTGINVDKDVDVLDSSYQPLSPLCKSVNDDCKYPAFIVVMPSWLTNNLQMTLHLCTVYQLVFRSLRAG